MAGSTMNGTSRHQFVGQRLRSRRRRLGMTQQQVAARLAELGVPCTNKTVSTLELGAGLDVAKLPELATVLDCSVTYLLGLSEDPGRWEPDVELRPQAVGDIAEPRILGPLVPSRGQAW